MAVRSCLPTPCASGRRPGLRHPSALHAGFRPLVGAGAFNTFTPPIIASMTYPYERFDKIPYPVYGRTKTPTAAVLEERLAALEGGEGCVTAGSGSQALFNLLFTLRAPGDNVVTSLNIFGEGYKQAAVIFPERCGVQFRFVKDPADPRKSGRGDRRPHQAGMGGDAEQPVPVRHRHPCRGRRRPRPRRPAAGRQHHRHRRASAAAGARRGHRSALNHQVPGRQRDRHRRRHRWARGADRGHPLEHHRIRRHDHAAVRLVADAAIPGDPVDADAAPQQQRPGGGRVPGRASQGQPGELHRPARAPAARPGAAADAGWRRADVVRRAGRHPRRRA